MIDFNEKKLILLLLLIAPTLTLFDVVSDLKEGVSFSHIVIEGMIVLSGLMALVLVALFLKSKREVLESSLAQTKGELAKTNFDMQVIKEGIHSKVVNELEEWKLTGAEKDVAFLLLKGMSTKDIALTRGSSEKTIRHQLSSIYQKSNLANKSEFQAYFLEDIF